jgi:CheY-like chemotaxis protein
MVENDLLHRKYLGMLLKKAHMVVMEASDGQSALEMLETREVDVVLTDINMPGMNGYELVMRIRRHPTLSNPSVPVIALTGTASEEDIARFREVGMNDYMVKPFTPKDLLRKLSDIMSSVSN